jgi:hypothetical protein
MSPRLIVPQPGVIPQVFGQRGPEKMASKSGQTTDEKHQEGRAERVMEFSMTLSVTIPHQLQRVYGNIAFHRP